MNKNRKVIYHNKMIDNISFSNYEKRMFLIFLTIIYKYQNSNVIEIKISELKEVIGEQRKANKEIIKIIKLIHLIPIFYKVENLIKDKDKIIANPGDYIQDTIFDRLIVNKENIIKFEIKDRYKYLFQNLKEDFSIIPFVSVK